MGIICHLEDAVKTSRDTGFEGKAYLLTIGLVFKMLSNRKRTPVCPPDNSMKSVFSLL